MKPLVALLCAIAAALVLSGCWSNMELTDRAFVQAAAIDLSDRGQYRLTAQIYKPGGMNAADAAVPESEKSYIAIMTENRSLLGAIRDATNELGRKLQLSHMRSLMIGEETAKTRNIGQILDFFTRDHEPRGNISVVIAKGAASRYLLIPPFIETTMGQQFKEIEHKSSSYSGKTLEVTLTDLDIRSKEEVPFAVVPYFRLVKEQRKLASAHGLAVIDFAKGTMTGFIPPETTPYVIILMNKFQGGVVELPCDNGERQKGLADSFEIRKADARIDPVASGNDLALGILVKLEGSIGELSCRRVVTNEEITEFTTEISREVGRRLKEALLLLQRQKADVIGVGERLSRHHHRLWRQWKPEWPNRFADGDFHIEVKVKLTNTGIQSGESKFVK